MDATGKQVGSIGKICHLYQLLDRFSSSCGDLESHRLFGLALPRNRTRLNFTTAGIP